MNKLKRKHRRILAYIFDMLIMIIAVILIHNIIPRSSNVANLNTELNNINDLLFSKKINLLTYYNRYSTVVHSVDKENILYSIMDAIYILIYFVIIPTFAHGKTLGKKIFNIKVVKTDKSKLTCDDLLMRSMVVNGLLYLLFSLVAVFVFSDIIYFAIEIILGIIQTFLLITSVFMVIYRKDDKGLQDLLAKTRVVDDNEVK
jgi:uncharacterized RDD family membrane protein YckC